MKHYFICDNGSCPYCVYIDETKHKVYVYKVKTRSLLLTVDNVIKVFLGTTKIKKYNGNTILLEYEKPRQYMCIYYEIITFTTSEPIIDYVSNIRSNDVPYPYALTKKNAYLVLEKIIIPRKEYENKEFIESDGKPIYIEDPYDYYNNFVSIEQMDRYKKFKYKQIYDDINDKLILMNISGSKSIYIPKPVPKRKSNIDVIDHFYGPHYYLLANKIKYESERKIKKMDEYDYKYYINYLNVYNFFKNLKPDIEVPDL